MTEPTEKEKDSKAIKNHRSRGVTAAVLEYFNKHPNQVLYLGDIAESTGFEKRSVQGAISNIRYNDVAEAKSRLKIEVAGSAWTWRSGRIASSEELYIKAYESKSGVTLVEDENGKLYKLTPIE